VLAGREPEPSGEEGQADVRVLMAIEKALESGREIRLGAFERSRRPSPDQVLSPPPRHGEAELVHVADPSRR
jgi:glucose-fructose oxidoreductase